MIQYPSGKRIRNQENKPATSSGRGMALEEDINATNAYYLSYDIANIHKKPTPIQVVNVDYPARNRAKITEAYYRQSSTTDYNGVYKGRAIDFEAKETRAKTSFPLASLHQHQIKHLESVDQHGAIAFVIIRFTLLDETYVVFAKELLSFLKTTTRKSIPLTWIKDNGHEVKSTYTTPCHYLEVLDKFIKESL